MKSGDRIPTGTGTGRRRLTTTEAAAGGLPEPFTPEEWQAIHREVLLADDDARRRTADATRAAQWGALQ